MYTLGLNAYHGDSAACIYKDTQLLAATEEERIRRIKHWAGLPTEAIKFCLAEADISIADVDIITVSRDPKAKFGKKLWHASKKLMNVKSMLDRGANSLKINSIKSDIASSLGVDPSSLKAKVQFIEHHRSHMASAFFISPFEQCAILSIDGMGDFTSTMNGVGEGNNIKVLDSISYPHSLGIFYTMFTQYLGFYNYGDEYKVMGLAPYGNPIYADKILGEVINQKVNGTFTLNGKYFKHFKEGVAMNWESGSPKIGELYTSSILDLFGQPRRNQEELTQHHFDIAASVQGVTEQVIFNLAEQLYRDTGLDAICLTGGVAQNSVANGKLIERTSFKKLFVPPAGHDAGTATGSALYYLHQKLQKPRPPFHPQPNTGASFTNEMIAAILDAKQIEYQHVKDDQLYESVAEALAQGHVVGWFQGKAEFGPRALGNRSILVDPRRADAKDLLNSKIKRRESFRPFAPSILREHASTYFEQVDDVPFMEKVFTIKKDKRSEIPAVTHVNGTGRLQTVDKKTNARYYNLINRFYQKTNIPILLNTSFNENEPIVNTPQHALDCFLRTKMDMLVLGNLIVVR